MSLVVGEPVPTPETLPYWEATRKRELSLPRCAECEAFFFYPRRTCPTCHGARVTWEPVSGVGTLVSYVINHRPVLPTDEHDPQVIALVELREGPRLTTNIVGCEPDPQALALGAPVRVDFQERGNQVLPVFRLSGGNK